MIHSDSWALVTGASSGIGWHISLELARRGCNIIGVSDQPGYLDQLRAEIEGDYPVQVVTIEQDLASEKSALSLFNYCVEHNLNVDILVNNAGRLVYGEMLGTGFDLMKSVLQLQLTTPALLCYLFGQNMKKQESGFILNVSSISAVMPYPTLALYGPTKRFLRDFTRAIRPEMKPFGISVTCLLPGATDTPLSDGIQINKARAKKFGLMKSPEKVASAGVEAMFRSKAECIPGCINKAVLLIVPLLPRFLIRFIFRNNLMSFKLTD